MSRYTIFAVIAALCLATTNAAVASNSFTSTVFAASPGVVFQGATGAADAATWGTYEAAYFGPGTTNGTVYAYGFDGGLTAPTLIASRSLNATLLSNGTAATTAASVTIADVTSGALTYSGAKIGVGLGSIGVAYVASDTATPACQQVYLAIYNGGTGAAIATIKVTSNVCSYCVATAGSTNGAGYANTVNNVFYENSTYYVSYTSALYTATAGSGANCAATLSTVTPTPIVPTSAQADTTTVSGSIQGIAATAAGTAKWTTPAKFYSGTAAATPAILYASLNGMCGPSNYTNSTSIYCTYQSATTGAYTISNVLVTVADGTVGSAATIATSTIISGTTVPQTIYAYTVAGFVHSQYQQGILLNNLATTYATDVTTPTATGYVNTLQFYNLTSGATATAGGVAITGYSNTYSGGQYGADGIPYGLGFGLVTRYASAASTYSSEIAAYFANGTINGTKVAYASGVAYGNAFVDANGALWAGTYSTDTTLTTGYLGTLVAQIYNAGNVLASFFALLSIMIAALFAF